MAQRNRGDELIMMVQLFFPDGKPLYVNPEHVSSVHALQPTQRTDWGSADNPLTIREATQLARRTS
jgi:hypothetical protein